ncbi:MAG: YncE family protein [Thaumarchaeota archaeon]|nr:YncE family protein [Nitrososphaerota archaeon]
MAWAGSLLTKVIIAIAIIGGIILAALFIPKLLPSAATITPQATTLDSGQALSIGVGWTGGSAPYTITLYSSNEAGCSTSSNVQSMKPGQTQPKFIFTVSPTVNTRYCGSVSSAGGSSAVSPSVLITVNPVLKAPKLILTPNVKDAGQSMTVAANVQAMGGTPPYTFALYSGSSKSCSADTTIVKVSSGTNPVSAVAGNFIQFSFASPSTPTYYCATVVNNAISQVPVKSATVGFTINAALKASVSPAAPYIDKYQSVQLSATASRGTAPYTYQWYTGAACNTPIAGQTKSTYSTGPMSALGSQAFSVRVTDNSTGAPIAEECAKSSVFVSPAFTGSPITIGSDSELDSGQTTELTVSWLVVGTEPWRVDLTTSPNPDCSGSSSTGMNMTGLFVSSATFDVSPTSNTFYCATVTDSARVPEHSNTTVAASVTVNPNLEPTVTLSPSATDIGQSANLTADVDLSTGTAPYSVSLFTSTTPDCQSNITLASTNEPNPQTGLDGQTAEFTLPSPGANTYYCASVLDSALTPLNVTSPSVQFVINPHLIAVVSPSLPSMPTGSSMTLNALAFFGTEPYAYQWYSGTTCSSLNAIIGETLQAFDTGVLTSTHLYSVLVTDSSQGTPAQKVCVPKAVTVTAALVPSLIMFPIAIDMNQSTTVTATVTWSGGTGPYTVTLRSVVPGYTCLTNTMKVAPLSGTNPKTGIIGTTTTFSFESPLNSTYYCASVRDSATVPSQAVTSTVLFTVNPTPGTVVLAISPKALDSGQSAPVTATVAWAGGSQPYTATLFSGSSTNCASDTLVVVPLSGSNPGSGLTGTSTTFTFTSPTSTTYYCVKVTDSSSIPLTITSPTAVFKVNAGLFAGAPSLFPNIIDYGQWPSITASAPWTGGTSPYVIALYSGTSTSCSLDTTLVAVVGGSNPLTGFAGSPGSFNWASPGASTYYCVRVTDSSAIPVTSFSPVSLLKVNPPLTAYLAPVTPSAIDIGQSTNITLKVTYTGGTSPYNLTLYRGISSRCALDTTPVISSPLIITSPFTWWWTIPSPASSTYYCAKVTDSSTVPLTVSSSSALFQVKYPPKVGISPPAPAIGSGQTAPLLTAIPLDNGGVLPYKYQWYTGPSCSSAILGQTSTVYSPGVLTTTTTFSVKISDSSVGIPTSLGTDCTSVTIGVGHGPEGIASNPTTGRVYVASPLSNNISVIDSGSNTVIKTISVGVLPWGVAVDPFANVIYVTNYGSGTVSVIDGTTNTVLATVTVGTHPEGVAVNPTLGQAYVANSGSNTVSVINTTTWSVITTFPVGSMPTSVAIGPSPTYTVFVTNYGSDTVSVIDMSFRVTTVPVQSSPWGVAVSPYTNKVYVTNSGSDTVSVLDGSTYLVVANVTVGSTPQGIAINSATSRAYVANTGSNTVTIIDTSTDAVISSSVPPIPIPVGTNPWGVSVLPAAVNMEYVTNSGSNTISVINILTNQVVAIIIVS